jgi:hypothetical protein
MKTNSRWLIILMLAGAGVIQASAAQMLTKGFVKREVFTNLLGAAVADLTGSAKFTGNQPDAVSLLGSFEALRRSGNQYGQRVSGWLVPPTTGDYVFFIASDDPSSMKYPARWACRHVSNLDHDQSASLSEIAALATLLLAPLAAIICHRLRTHCHNHRDSLLLTWLEVNTRNHVGFRL